MLGYSSTRITNPSEPGKTGLIAPTPDVETINATIQDYFSNYDKETFIDNIKQLKQELSWKVFAERLVEMGK